MSPLPWGSRAHWASVARSHRGFSIIGVIVAAGMAGGLALLLTRITKEQMVSQKKAETGLEITQVQHKVLSAFYDGDACTQTMGGQDIANLQPVTKINNRSGTVILTTGTSINRLVEVSSIIPQNPQGRC